MITLFINAIHEAIAWSGGDSETPSLDKDVQQIIKYMPFPPITDRDKMGVEMIKIMAARTLVRDCEKYFAMWVSNVA